MCLLKGLQGNILMDSLMWVGDVDGVLGDEQKSKGGTNWRLDCEPLLLANKHGLFYNTKCICQNCEMYLSMRVLLVVVLIRRKGCQPDS